VSPLCERKGYNIVSNQGFFIDFIGKSCLTQLEKTALDEGKEHIRKQVLDQCEKNKELWKQQYTDKFDAENHSIAVLEKDSLPNKPCLLPDEEVGRASVIPFPQIVSNEALLAEVASYRSSARDQTTTIATPIAH